MKSMEIEPASSIAKGTSNLATIRVVKWRRDPQNYPVIKEIVTNSNKDAIVLQARGKELKGNHACLSCKAEFGPFLSCVIDEAMSPPMGHGACANCIWGA